MKDIDSLKLLDGLDDELIGSAEKLVKKRSPLKTVLPIAAGLCLVIGAALVLSKVLPRGEKPEVSALASEAPTASEEHTEVPSTAAPTAVLTEGMDIAHYVYGRYNASGVFELMTGSIHDGYDPEAEPTVSFLKGFFIYKGRLYTEFVTCGAFSDIIGGKVCEISRIDRAELYNELTASIGLGQPPQIDPAKYEGMGTSELILFEVKGYDPEFMLCMRDEGRGNIIVYTSDSGLTDQPASVLFEDVLALGEDADNLYYSVMKIDESGDHKEYQYVLDPNDYAGQISQFTEALNSAEWIDDTRNPLSYSFIDGSSDEFQDYPNSYGTYVSLPLRNGFVLSLYVYSDGIIEFPYSYFDKSLKADPDKLAPFLELVESEAGVRLISDPLSARTIEACRADEHMGYLVPDYLPNGFVYRTTVAFYEYDHLSGAIIDTEKIRIEYKNHSTGAVINLWILKPEEFERESEHFKSKGGTVVPLGKLTLNDIVEYCTSPGSPDDVVCHAAVTDGEYGICVEALGADAKTVYAILHSILN